MQRRNETGTLSELLLYDHVLFKPCMNDFPLPFASNRHDVPGNDDDVGNSSSIFGT